MINSNPIPQKVIPISGGGTSATNWTDALTNLGILVYGSTDESTFPAGVNGQVLIAYEPPGVPES